MQTDTRVSTLEHRTGGLWTHAGRLVVSRQLEDGSIATVMLPDDPATGFPIIDKGGQVYNVRAYGASPGASAATNSTAFDAAAAACKAAGGGTIFIPSGAFSLARAWAITQTDSSQGIKIQGAGVYSTRLVAPNTSTDILVCGENGKLGGFLNISDLGFYGGRYQLRLNNQVQGRFCHLFFYTHVTAIYTEGQNEDHTFQDIHTSNSAGTTIDIGNSNGATSALVSGTDFPEMQKCVWDHLRIQGVLGDYAIKHSSAVIDGARQVSGWNTFRNVHIMGHRRNGVLLSNSFGVTFQDLTTEGLGRDASNTYVDLILGDSGQCGQCSFEDIGLGVDSGQTSVKYFITYTSGSHSTFKNVSTSGIAATADIQCGTSMTVIDANLAGGAATGIEFSGPGTRGFTGINVFDSSTLRPIYGTGDEHWSQVAQDLVNGSTIDVSQKNARVQSVADVTGVILPVGHYTSQEVTVLNFGSHSVTFAAFGTSHVLAGAAVTIPTCQSRRFVWDWDASGGTGAWL